MAMSTNPRQKMHALVDRWPLTQLAPLEGLLQSILDPLSRKLASALPEDEVVSADEEQAVAEAKQSRLSNKPVAHQEVLADFGLTMEDFQKMALCPPSAEPNGDRH